MGVHRAWLKQEKFVDPFQSALRLDVLRQGGISGGAAADGNVSSSVSFRVSQVAQILDGRAAAAVAAADSGSDSEPDGLENPDEDSVLRLMEILELPRSVAIDLLQLHEGDLEAAVLNAFTS